MKSQSPIIWAIDPYQGNSKSWQRSKELASYASRSLKHPLQPIYIADRGSLLPLNAFDPEEVKSFIHKSELRLNRLLRPIHSRKISRAKVLFSNGYGTKGNVELLDSYANKSGSPMMITTTNGRRGVERFLQGSFAETLVAISKVPIVLVNPKCHMPKRIRHIVFATDFSRLSCKALRKVCDMAKIAKAKLTIVSVLPDPFLLTDPSVLPLSDAGDYFGQKVLKKERRSTLRSGARLVELARRQGIPASFSLQEAPEDSVSSAILKSAVVNKADMIAIAARGDTSKVHLFGSTAQRIIRNSRLPVWVCHAENIKTKVRFLKEQD